MKLLSRSSRIILASLACLLAVSLNASTLRAAAPPTALPYFKVFGSGVYTGGYFSAKNSSGCAVNYQYSPSGSSSATGGILSFIKLTGGRYYGASSQYEAYATGPIDGSAANYGFYTGRGQKVLTFANTSSVQWGGYFDGSVPQSDCIPDYFDNQQNSPQAASGDITSLNGLSNQYLYQNAGVTHLAGSGALSVAAGQKVTLFIKGNLYIENNVTYAGYTDTTVPKLAVVVQGNIYVAPTVSQLDGLYIAQPSSPADTSGGQLWTCYDTSQLPGVPETLATWPQWVVTNCSTASGHPSLIFNGAVIARQVSLMRTNGDVASANVNEDTLDKSPFTNPNYAYNSTNIAELFNYNPSMIFLGGGFFNQSPPTFHIDSLTNLPPVF